MSKQAKIKDPNLKELKELAAMIPKTFEEYWAPGLRLGSELIKEKIDCGIAKINPDELYNVKIQKFREVNHFTKLKKIYRKNGLPGCHEYLMQQIELHKAQGHV